MGLKKLGGLNISTWTLSRLQNNQQLLIKENTILHIELNICLFTLIHYVFFNYSYYTEHNRVQGI